MRNSTSVAFNRSWVLATMMMFPDDPGFGGIRYK